MKINFFKVLLRIVLGFTYTPRRMGTEITKSLTVCVYVCECVFYFQYDSVLVFFGIYPPHTHTLSLPLLGLCEWLVPNMLYIIH